MANLSKEPAPGVSEEERKNLLSKAGIGLRKNKRTGGFYTVQKRSLNKKSKKKS